MKHALPSDFSQSGRYIDHKHSGCFLEPLTKGGWRYRAMLSGLDGTEFDRLSCAMQFIREVTGTEGRA